MDERREYDEDQSYLVVSAPPVLPVNQAEEMALVDKAYSTGGLRRQDYVAHLQRIGIVPSQMDPSEYADLVDAERDAVAEAETERGQRMLGTAMPPEMVAQQDKMKAASETDEDASEDL
jgi:hypothetical protein